LFNELFVHDLLHSDVRVYRWRAWRVRKVTAKRPDGQARPPRWFLNHMRGSSS
jgi:hypothetical protein